MAESMGPPARVYRVEPLSAERALIAYPVVAAAFPAVGLERWRGYARTVTQRPEDEAGLLGLSTAAEYFCGLLIYRNDREPWHEPRLSVELLVAVDAIAVPAATEALLTAAEAKAAALACTMVQVRVERGPHFTKHFRLAGYRPSVELMTKKIATTDRVN